MRDVDVTFVPGAAGVGAFWDPVAQRLPSAWRKRCLDLPGLGSVPSRPDVQSYSDLADYVAGDLDGPTVLIGHSMGGFVSLQLVLRYPALVRRLVLVVAAGGVDMASHGALDWRVRDREEEPRRAAWARAETPDLSSQLHRITVPVLLIWATRDALSPLGVAHQLARELPDARLLTFDTDDHWLARRFADQTAAAIREWIES